MHRDRRTSSQRAVLILHIQKSLNGLPNGDCIADTPNDRDESEFLV